VTNYHSIGCLLDCPCQDEVKCCKRKNKINSAVREVLMQNGAAKHPDGIVANCDVFTEDPNSYLPMSILSTTSHTRSIPALNTSGNLSQSVNQRNSRPKSTGNLERLIVSASSETALRNSTSCLDQTWAAPIDVTCIATGGFEATESGKESVTGTGSSVALRYRSSEVSALELAIKRMSRELDDIRGDNLA